MCAVRNIAWITGIYKVLWRKSAVAYVKILSDHLSGRTNLRNPQSVYPGRDRYWNPETFACEVVRRITSARPKMYFCLKLIVTVIISPVVLTLDARCVLFRLCSSRSVGCHHNIPLLVLTMHPYCLPCCHVWILRLLWKPKLRYRQTRKYHVFELLVFHSYVCMYVLI